MAIYDRGMLRVLTAATALSYAFFGSSVALAAAAAPSDDVIVTA